MSIAVREAVNFSLELFNSAETIGYPNRLISSLERIVDFDIFSIIHFGLLGPPNVIYDNFSGLTSSDAMKSYMAGTYLLDPVYVACRKGVSGLHRLTDLLPDNYYDSEYFSSINPHPCVSEEPGLLSEEVVYIIPLGGSSVALSLMRLMGHSRFSAEAFANLLELEPIVLESFGRYWRTCMPIEASPNPQRPDPADELETAFSEFAKEELSPREQTVVSFLLRGHSTLSVSHNLGIAEGTAKIHRKNIYEKLRISSQAQLFLLFCNHLLAKRSPAKSPSPSLMI